ncbi:hypothetical protein B0A52_08471 [Exophiala mesophila]|uniref:Zn(2)-C6 fungal-type domain-containing protein n=1 Tax=Exophiala mesophila TaxID=212818 RepID=A0A438MY74_EXOME|nr:hypothetical protein B0A52_08471 [Exophiala mesophila]
MEPASEAARALRESFGDRKPIDISRKITACVACRKQKVKCFMGTDGSPPCTRCKKRGISCTVNRSLQMLLENDVSWKSTVEKKLQVLEDSVGKLNQLAAVGGHDSRFLPSLATASTRLNALAPATDQTPPQRSEQAWEVVMDLNQGPGVVPASVVSEVPAAGGDAIAPNQRQPVDLIDQGVISLTDAQEFFDLYYRRLDHFLYRILAEHDSLASIRKSSSLLTAAVCTVGALHQSSPQYQPCYQHFVQLASSQMFSKKNNHDDVRALCIGAFWLSDISWSLLGQAARLAGELNLHRCIPKAPHTKKACFLRTRLYYLVYICDHHLSIVYGRPPLTRDFGAITPPSEFLKSSFATEDDTRLISQVEIWIINTRVFDHFSLDPSAHLSDRLIPQLRRLGIALDTWRADWYEKFQTNLHVGNYPRKGVDLHYHFAKLFLCSHVFRRPSGPIEGSTMLEPELIEFSNTAISSATSIVQAIIGDEEIQSYLHGLPAYFDTMIAFAFVFLLKLTIKYPGNIWIDKAGILDMLDKAVSILESLTTNMHPRHLLTSIVSSMRKLLDRSMQSTDEEGNALALNSMLVGASGGGAGAGADASFAENEWFSPTDAMFLEQYDFADFNFDIDFDPTPNA